MKNGLCEGFGAVAFEDWLGDPRYHYEEYDAFYYVLI
jgi:hypothetical protein